MRIRVSYVIDADDRLRRAINRRYGRPGLATREEVVRWFEGNGTNEADDLLEDHGAPETDN